ncbi:MAG: response regulator transcription factor [Anaerolineae bacterium]|nr:response regulator transcription factor [Anaerolineae bacterium]MCB9103498.1 response regulator transcription factor [Anaerolineales bacterium]
MIRVLICDDQEVVCEGLRVILNSAAGIEVAGVAYDGAAALDLIPTAKPDLVLMDLKMPGLNGIQATRLIHQRYPEIRVLVLTTYDGDEWVLDAIRSGAAGYLLKDSPREALIAAIKGTIDGKTHVDPGVAGTLLAQIARTGTPPTTSLTADLSERELEVLRHLARGLTNLDIADRLHLSEGTIRNYVSAVFTKLGVSDRTQAAVIALRYGLVDLNEL